MRKPPIVQLLRRFGVGGSGSGTPWARASNNVKKPQSQMCESYRKLDVRFLYNETETFLVSVAHLILRFAIVQNKFQQTNKNKINHTNDNHIKFEVSLHFGGIWPTVCHLSSCAIFVK